MAIWQYMGSFTGGFVGGVLGLPVVGVSVGGFLGSFVDNYESEQTRICRVGATIGGFLLRETDGITAGRLSRTAQVLTQWIPDCKINHEQIVKTIRTRAFDRDGLNAIEQALHDDPEAAISCVLLTARVAAAGDGISRTEREWIDRFATRIGLPTADVSDLLALYDRAVDAISEPDNLSADRELLVVDANVSDDELRRAYRRAASPLHPDRFINESDDRRREVGIRYRRIGEAFERLRAKRSPDLFAVRCGLEGPVCPSEGDVVRCLICERRNRIPAADGFPTARCGECQALLLHPRPMAQKLYVGHLERFGQLEADRDRLRLQELRDHLGKFAADRFEIYPALTERTAPLVETIDRDWVGGPVLAASCDKAFWENPCGFVVTPTGIAWSHGEAGTQAVRFDEIRSVTSVVGGLIAPAAVLIVCGGVTHRLTLTMHDRRNDLAAALARFVERAVDV